MKIRTDRDRSRVDFFHHANFVGRDTFYVIARVPTLTNSIYWTTAVFEFISVLTINFALNSAIFGTYSKNKFFNKYFFIKISLRSQFGDETTGLLVPMISTPVVWLTLNEKNEIKQLLNVEIKNKISPTEKITTNKPQRCIEFVGRAQFLLHMPDPNQIGCFPA